MQPFPEGTNDPDEKTFNKELSRARVVVDRAFEILKGRWRVLQKRLDSSLNFAIKITIACIVLHNFCIEANDDWDDDDDDGPPNNDGNNNVVVGDADEIRGALKDFVCGNVKIAQIQFIFYLIYKFKKLSMILLLSIFSNSIATSLVISDA